MTTPEGFAVIPTWLLRDGAIDHRTKLLYCHLSSRVGKTGICWPSQARLADEMDMSVRQVRRYITEAKRLGLIEVITTKTPTGKRNSYRLLVDPFGRGG